VFLFVKQTAKYSCHVFGDGLAKKLSGSNWKVHVIVVQLSRVNFPSLVNATILLPNTDPSKGCMQMALCDCCELERKHPQQLFLSLVPRLFPPLVFDHLQYATMEREIWSCVIT